MEVAGVTCDSRQPVLNVFQHQIVFRLLDSQSSVDVADDKVVRQKGSPVCCVTANRRCHLKWRINKHLQLINLQNLRNFPWLQLLHILLHSVQFQNY